MAYDIIGDIHGQADKLHGLLAHLGYRATGGTYRHPTRSAIFVGDFIDRGDKQLASLNTVRRMVDAGSALAVMGNHEFNAIAWHTPDPARQDDFCRTRTGALGDKNREQHKAFLREVEHDPKLHNEWIDWFLTLPLWLDLPSIRVVHACWHEEYMAELRPRLTPERQLTRETIVCASRSGSMEFTTVEALTKGLEVPLPQGHTFLDKDGHSRDSVRTRWWDGQATTYRELAMISEDIRQRLPTASAPIDARAHHESSKPIFFGHYWMTGTPVLQTSRAACVDYSAAKDGPLVAYRWDGESELDLANFVSIG